jgi:hypothetical protein
MSRPALVATIPRSGTWYSLLFFWAYDQLLKDKWWHFLTGATPSIIDGVLEGVAADKRHKMSDVQDFSETLGINPFYVFHTVCPGYERAEDPLRLQWEQLNFSLPYNSHERFGEDAKRLDPEQSSQARIVYLYRNPLDHFVSYFRVTQAHEWDVPRTKDDGSGKRVPVTDLHDFIFNASALESYLKQFHTFKVMSRLYPKHVLMIPYEAFSSDPGLWFHRILAHIGAPVRGLLARKAFNSAFNMTKKGSIVEIERRMNRSLSGELRGSERHIGSGKVGQWKGRLSDAEISAIEAAFGKLGYSLADFQLG